MKQASFTSHSLPLILKAPAKINWFLRITGKRDDGYHNISSLFQCIDLYDDLSFTASEGIELICDLDIPIEENIVYRTACLLKKLTSSRKGARITLNKNIPHGAGLGGGSSDAACALKGLNTIWRLGLTGAELSSIALEIGSDVPFFLKGPSALAEGRGERLQPLKVLPSVDLLIVKPDVSVSTAWAYSSYDALRKLTKKAIDIKLFIQAFNRQDFAFLRGLIENDLEKVVAERYPVVGDIKSELARTGAVISAMTGSGSAVFGVFENRKKAEEASKAVQPCWSRVVKTLI
jgi:4-diphosphocytidyl-2-C-methyl-D-erythritol kinase